MMLFKINDFSSLRNSFLKAIWENYGVPPKCCDVGLEKEFKVERRFEDDSLQNQRFFQPPELLFKGDLIKFGVPPKRCNARRAAGPADI